MKRGEALELAKNHAPILWFCKDECYMPEDCEFMVKNAVLKKWNRGKRNKVPNFTNSFESLRKYGNRKDFYLDLGPLDIENIRTEKHGFGHRELAKAAAEHYSNYPPKSDRNFKYYVQVSDPIKIDRRSFKHNCCSKIFSFEEQILGKYFVLRYFYFYTYNDFVNIHEGDWDSTVEILINKDTGKKFVNIHAHEYVHLAEISSSSSELPKFDDWLKKWSSPQPPRKNLFKPIYHYDGHPFVFVALGSHGAYPAPGYTRCGLKIPLCINVVISSDIHKVGEICLVPEEVKIEPDLIQFLNEKDIPHTREGFPQLKGIKWERELCFENIEDATVEEKEAQQWYLFKGLWGERVNRNFDSGPEGPHKHSKRLNKPKEILSRFNRARNGKCLSKEKFVQRQFWIVKPYYEI